MHNLVAHRGHAAKFPENTLPAFASAIQLGCRFVECDIQIAGDGVPMVVHDTDLSRTAGAPVSVFDLTAEALATYSVHEPRRFKQPIPGATLPTLRQFVAMIDAAPDVTAFIEIKVQSIERWGLSETMDAVLAVSAPLADRGVIISFSFEAIEYARRRGFRIGPVLTNYDAQTRARLEDLRPECVFCDHHKLPADGSPLWPGSWQWVMYEVDRLDLARDLLKRGAHLLETMRVAELGTALTAA